VLPYGPLNRLPYERSNGFSPVCPVCAVFELMREVGEWNLAGRAFSE
jgi:hypothetical protein